MSERRADGGEGDGERGLEVPDRPRSEPGAEPEGEEAPDRSLLVPLVVAPALTVMVLVLVVTLFGMLAESESSPEENVERLLHGGFNDRRQAAFELVRQILEDWDARAQGREAEWEVDESLLPRLRLAWAETLDMEDPGDVPIPLAVAILLAHLGDADGVERLAGMTRLSPSLDPEGEYRLYAGFALGSLGGRRGDELAGAERAVAARALIDFLDEEDEGLRNVGAIALQTLPTPETVPALRGLLTEPSLDLRANAALSLARLGDPAGAGVLREMLSEEPYRAEHRADEERWARASRIAHSRRKALEALASLGLEPPPAELERLAEDEDPGVRELARELAAEGS